MMPRSTSSKRTDSIRSIPLIVAFFSVFVSFFCAINFYLAVHLDTLDDAHPNGINIIPSFLHFGLDGGGALKYRHDQNTAIGYDVVTVVHHDDMDILIEHGLQSYVDKLIDFPQEARIYAICTEKAMVKLLALKREYEHVNDQAQIIKSNIHNSTWSRVYPINENIFPFNITDLKNARSDKPTWNYQQLLKLYTHRALTSNGYPVYRKFVVVDADTILTKPLYMEEPPLGMQQSKDREEGLDNVYRRPFVCIASVSSGAFENDALVAGETVRNFVYFIHTDVKMMCCI